MASNVRVPEQSTKQESSVSRREGAPGRPSDYSLNPFSLMRRLSDEMDRVFASSFGIEPWGSLRHEERGSWVPPVEVRERDGQLVISAELPGMNKDDVKVEVTDEGLLLRGERKREHEEKREGFYRSERSYGRFYRLVPLPEGTDPEKAKAQFKDGVLTVELPIPESSQRKRREIPIKS